MHCDPLTGFSWVFTVVYIDSSRSLKGGPMAHTGDSNKGTASGHTFVELVIPNASFPRSGAKESPRSELAIAASGKGRTIMCPTGNEFIDVRLDGSKSVERQNSDMGSAGEFGQGVAPEAPAVPEGNYPNVFNYGPDPNNREFSNDKASTPEQMATETGNSQDAFAELQHFLNNSLETPGSRVCHPLDTPWTPPTSDGQNKWNR
jgi:hypothetical protein